MESINARNTNGAADPNGSNIPSITASILGGFETNEMGKYSVLARPLESIGLTQKQEESFLAEGGIIVVVDSGSLGSFKGGHISVDEIKGLYSVQRDGNKMIHLRVNIEDLKANINDHEYSGFALWKEIYKEFPAYSGMNIDQATHEGLYPFLNYRNYGARSWFAKSIGGDIARTQQMCEVYDSLGQENNYKKCAKMGLAPLGLVRFGNGVLYHLGLWVRAGSSDLQRTYGGPVSVMSFYYIGDESTPNNDFHNREDFISSMVIMSKEM